MHGCVDAKVAIVVHLGLPVDSHLRHLLGSLHVDHGGYASTLQLLDLGSLVWVWTKVDAAVADLRDGEVLVEETVVLVDDAVNEVARAGVRELVGVGLAELASVLLGTKNIHLS